MRACRRFSHLMVENRKEGQGWAAGGVVGNPWPDIPERSFWGGKEEEEEDEAEKQLAPRAAPPNAHAEPGTWRRHHPPSR